MNKEDILKILEGAKDKNGDVPMRLVRLAFKKLPEPCTDTISRQAAIDALRKLYICEPKINNDYAYDMALDLADDVIKNLPSAQPERKTGKWINHRNDNGHNIADCSECGEALQWFDGDSQPNFCPMCGADMRGEQDER